MAPHFTKKNFIKQFYHLVNEKADPYDDVYSVKAAFDEASSDTSSAETLLEDRGDYPRRQSHYGSIAFASFNFGLFCLSILFFALSGLRFMQSEDRYNNEIVREISEYSPILDSMHIPFVEIERNGSFTDPAFPSIYRLPPSPEVDAAWARIGNIDPIPMSSEQVRKRGVDPRDTARFPPMFGFGDDAHIARLDVFHQIHCLDALRKEIWFDHYYGGKFVDDVPTPSHRAHVSHCLEMVLQALTCSASVEPIMHYWVDIEQVPFPNFNDKHICRDFDAILDWQEKHSVNTEYFQSTIRRPSDAIIHHMSEGYKQALSKNQVATNIVES